MSDAFLLSGECLVTLCYLVLAQEPSEPLCVKSPIWALSFECFSAASMSSSFIDSGPNPPFSFIPQGMSKERGLERTALVH